MERIESIEQKLAILMINTEESFVLIDKNLNVVSFNEQFKKQYLLFFGKEIQKGEPILKYAQSHRIEILKKIYERVFDGEIEESEITVPFPDKTSRTFFLRYKPAFDENGLIMGAFVSSVEITERKNAELKLRRSEERFRLFMKYTPALTWLTDEEGILVFANETFYKTQNLKPGIIGKSIFDIFPKDVAAKMHENNLEVIRNNKNIEVTEIVPDVNGDMRYYSVHKFPINNALDKNLVGGFALDFTNKLRAEEKLRQNEERLRAIVDNEPECVKVVDRLGRLLDMNFAGLKMIEAETFEEVKDKQVIELIHPEDRKKYLDLHVEACNGNKGTASFRIIGLKQTLRWMEMHAVPLRNEAGEIFATLSVTRDVTDRKKAEDEKEFERRDKEALINSTQDSIWSLNKEFNLIAANSAFVNSLKNAIGVMLEPGDNLLLNKYFPDEFISFWKEHYAKALSGEAHKTEVYFPPLNGIPESWAEVSFNPIYDREEIIGIACYARNITDNKKNEQELIKLNDQIHKKAEELAKSNQELEQFAYIASHDLQEPLRMVANFLTQLEKKYKDQLDERANQYIHFAVDGAVRMKRIISDLLEYSRTGQERYELKKINMNELVQEVIQLNRTIIEERKAIIKFDTLPNIFASRTPMLQVFQNLIGNALKYQKPNEIPIIKIHAFETELFWEFRISDNGIGIDSKFYDKIFILFQRFHQRDEYSGTGMGLAICKKIIGNHGGKIWVDSKIMEGSSFYFTIPKEMPE